MRLSLPFSSVEEGARCKWWRSYSSSDGCAFPVGVVVGFGKKEQIDNEGATSSEWFTAKG